MPISYHKIGLLLFHPLTIPLWTIFLIFSSGSYLSYLSPEIKQLVYYVLTFATIVLPLLIISFLYFSKLVPNIFDSNKKDRIVFYSILSFSFFFAWNIMNRLPVSKYIVYTCSILALSYFVHTTVLLFSKTSMYLVGWGSATGIILALSLKMQLDFYTGIIFLFLTAGLVGSWILKLKLAKPSEIYSGFISGFAWVFMLAIWFF